MPFQLLRISRFKNSGQKTLNTPPAQDAIQNSEAYHLSYLFCTPQLPQINRNKTNNIPSCHHHESCLATFKGFISIIHNPRGKKYLPPYTNSKALTPLPLPRTKLSQPHQPTADQTSKLKNETCIFLCRFISLMLKKGGKNPLSSN